VHFEFLKIPFEQSYIFVNHASFHFPCKFRDAIKIVIHSNEDDEILQFT